MTGAPAVLVICATIGFVVYVLTVLMLDLIDPAVQRWIQRRHDRAIARIRAAVTPDERNEP